MTYLKVFDSLNSRLQMIAVDMADAAINTMHQHGHITTLQDDRIAIFHEACAVYLKECVTEQFLRTSTVNTIKAESI